MDEWAICGNKGTISGTKFTANAPRVAAYGKNLISNGICQWKIRYNITGSQCCREIGISDNQDILDNYLHCAVHPAIVWHGTTIYSKGTNKGNVENIDKNNDVITITLDLTQNKVSFYKNKAKDKTVMIDIEPNRSYRLAAHLDTNGQSFTILSFHHAQTSPKLLDNMDEWAICGNKGAILGNKFIANDCRVSAYGKRVISNGICEWKIRYNITGAQCCRTIGIADNQYNLDGENTNSCQAAWYDSSIRCKGTTKANVENIDKDGDVITVKLDLIQNKASFYKNGAKDKTVVVDVEPNKSYRLAAHLDRDGQQFTILSFHSDQCMTDISLENLKGVLSETLQKLNALDSTKLSQMAWNDLVNFQKQIGDSRDDMKEIEQSFDELKQKMTSFKDIAAKLITTNTAQYQNWTAKDIIGYICLLENGKFAGYADVLLKSFTEQGITGRKLLDIKKNDLESMGIKSSKDTEAIYKHFQALKKCGNEGDNDTLNID